MGCGGSKATQGDFKKTNKKPRETQSKGRDGIAVQDLESTRNGSLNNGRDNVGRQPSAPSKAPVAFDIDFGDGGHKEESLIKKHPPKKFQRLEPLPGTRLTADMLAEKQREAEERKERQLQRRAKSAQRSERRRQQALENKQRVIAQGLPDASSHPTEFPSA